MASLGFRAGLSKSLVLPVQSLCERSSVPVPSPTFGIVAGLGQGLAVGQHGDPGHGDTHDTALFARLVLEKRERGRV